MTDTRASNQRVKKASLNMLWLLIYEISIFACNMILPRLIIRNYGSAYNGLISSITQFLNIVSILRLGVAGATRVSLYKTLSQNDNAGTSAIVKATELYMRKIGCVIAVYVAVLAIGYPLLIKREFGFWDTAVLIVAIGSVTFAQYFYGITYRTLLQADQRLYINNIFQTVTVIANTVISSFLIVAGMSIQAVKLISALIFVMNPVVLNRYVRKYYQIDTKCVPDNAAISKKRDVMGHSIANIIHENTDVIVITLFCDIKMVSVYTVYNTVIGGLKQVLSIFTTGAESVFGNMWAKGEMNSIRRNLSLFEHMIAVFVSVVFSSAIVLILPFVSLYTKNVWDVNYIIPVYAAIIITAQAVFSIRTPYQTLVQAAGFYKETKKAAYFEAATNIISSVILVQIIGIVGTAIGTLLANIIRTVQYMLFASRRIVQRSCLVFVKRMIWIAGNVTICVFACGSIVKQFAYRGWLFWVLSGAGTVIFSSVICLAMSLIFYRNDLLGLVRIAVRMIRRN